MPQKGQIHTVFFNRLQDLQTQAGQLADAHAGAGQRVWQTPAGFTNDLLAIGALHEPAFNRELINDNYLDAMKAADDPGTVGDIVSLKLQMDYNATEERAFRLRHATLCRCAAFAAGRRRGHRNYTVFAAVEQHAADMLAAGGAP